MNKAWNKPVPVFTPESFNLFLQLEALLDQDKKIIDLKPRGNDLQQMILTAPEGSVEED